MAEDCVLTTLSMNYQKARPTNETTASTYRSIVPTTIEPVSATTQDATSRFVFELTQRLSDAPVQNLVQILPYAIGSNNNTFSLRVIAWRKVLKQPTSTTVDIWIPVPLVEVQCTISSTLVGTAGASILNTEMFADTIALTGTTANDDVSVDIVSPANDTIGHLVVDMKGASKLELVFITGSSATSCNALVAMY